MITFRSSGAPFTTLGSLAPRSIFLAACLTMTSLASAQSEGAVNYCSSVTNTTGNAAVMGWSGSATVANDDLVIEATGVPDDFAMFFYGMTQDSLAVPFIDGLQCLGNPVRLGPIVQVFGNAISRPVTSAEIGSPMPGDTRYFQLFYRDFGNLGAAARYSDGLAVTFGNGEPCDATAQMACIAAGNEPCTVGVNSADCGPLIEVCTAAIQMACGDVGLLPCSPGINSTACGGDVCSPQAIFNCVQAGLSPCLPGTTTCEPACTCTITELLACVNAGMGACIMGGNCACT